MRRPDWLAEPPALAALVFLPLSGGIVGRQLHQGYGTWVGVLSGLALGVALVVLVERG
ncbi:hypothetical protein HHL19_21050 [Streptomyces sp. R302]|uniref:hypothetical protein n=1 Tax=unclassified Streptomyces TaxID=2593676 RepID=UPI00145D7264|nr:MULTISPECIES: hypothetical protein [unclassified Streptomyces]NML50992.1 hypothetical protein [Streptomyces sp. R301]NML81086.1 hypothetical protein [Streptomyces sp. R302]